MVNDSISHLTGPNRKLVKPDLTFVEAMYSNIAFIE